MKLGFGDSSSLLKLIVCEYATNSVPSEGCALVSLRNQHGTVAPSYSAVLYVLQYCHYEQLRYLFKCKWYL